jgi:arsenite-transporting ATPase
MRAGFVTTRAGFTLTVLLFTACLAASDDCPADVVRDGSLQDVVNNEKLQFIFVGGKGGVGKTTTSSSLAIALAQRRAKDGKKVLLISTDPAHSLSDAFRPLQFTGEPMDVPGAEGLQVMEIDPSIILGKELNSWKKLTKDAGLDGMLSEVQKLQEWLTAIPGIDEATALSSVIGLIERGLYSAIVFDTAPTGHTLKLLALPDVLEIGLSKLQSWQSKLWGYYEMFNGLMNADKNKKRADPEKLKKKLEKKLRKYKNGIAKVGAMLKDNERTTFIPVCIAEYLSISETKRLLQELDGHKIHKGHIVVNQLILDGFNEQEMNSITTLTTAGATTDEARALQPRIVHALELMNSRHNIQKKYLQMLAGSEEARCLDIIKAPLLGKEVTGVANLTEFSKILIDGPKTLIDGNSANSNEEL